MLAYIQVICSADIKRYSANVGVVIFLRVSFAMTVLFYSSFSELLPMQFILIAVVDTIFVGLLVLFATKKEDLKVCELFAPQNK